MFVVADTLIEFDVKTIEEVTRQGMRNGRGIGFQVSRERDFEGLERGEDGGGLEVLNCVNEMACTKEEEK